jgi:hypothetical protein
VPEGAGRPAVAVIGPSDIDAADENRWRAVTRETFCWPYTLHLHRGRLAVADSSNNCVMIWDCGPTPDVGLMDALPAEAGGNLGG